MSKASTRRSASKKKTIAARALTNEKREQAVVRLPALLKKRLNLKLAEEGRKFQEVAVELITRYVDGDVFKPADLELQIRAARASMRKNAVALRELAK